MVVTNLDLFKPFERKIIMPNWNNCYKKIMTCIGLVLAMAGLGLTHAANASDDPAKNLLWICLNGECGYINGKGEIVISPRFEKAEDFAANGLARVMVGGEYGYINSRGEIVIPPIHGDAHTVAASGLTIAVVGGKFGFIDAAGEMVIPPKFARAYDFSANGLALRLPPF